ncbi:MAG: GAF domain-containing SpoIIE family protein phosphatase [Planctomycetota bacterium]
MLREVIEIASLEDFVNGLARASRLRVCVYDHHGELIIASPPVAEYARLTGQVLRAIPRGLALSPVPAHDPPGRVGFAESGGVWYVLAPVYDEDRVAGYMGIGEFRDGTTGPARPPARLCGAGTATAQGLPAADEVGAGGNPAEIDLAALRCAWEKLPPLDRSGHAQAVVTARWGARQLAEWARRESRLIAASDEVSLVGDIAELLSGEHDLQKVLERIVAETARVMQCQFCSMRLYDEKTDELRIKAVYNLPPAYLGKGAVLRTASEIDDEALRGNVVYVPNAASDPRVQYPEELHALGIVSMLTVGMIYRGKPIGIIRVYTKHRQRFRKPQRDLLRAVACQAATAIVHAQLIEERLRSVEVQRQLALAGELQERLIRVPPPTHPLLETALAFHPTYEVAGDFCDFVRLCDGRIVALVGDVAGKGIPASLLMSSVRGALRAYAECCLNPAELLMRLNQQLCRETLPNEFVTLLLLAMDRGARGLTYASAGHEPLLILRKGEILQASDGDLVLGIEAEEVYHEHRVAVEPGDLLLLYTDGAIEARNFADEEFGRARLWESLRAYGGLRPEQVLKNIVWDIRRFVGLAEQSDDLTLVAVRVTG